MYSYSLRETDLLFLTSKHAGSRQLCISAWQTETSIANCEIYEIE